MNILQTELNERSIPSYTEPLYYDLNMKYRSYSNRSLENNYKNNSWYINDEYIEINKEYNKNSRNNIIITL